MEKRKRKDLLAEYKLKWKPIQYVGIAAGRGLMSREVNEGGNMWVYLHFLKTHGRALKKKKKLVQKTEYTRLNFEKVVICYIKCTCVCVIYIYICTLKIGPKILS